MCITDNTKQSLEKEGDIMISKRSSILSIEAKENISFFIH